MLGKESAGARGQERKRTGELFKKDASAGGNIRGDQGAITGASSKPLCARDWGDGKERRDNDWTKDEETGNELEAGRRGESSGANGGQAVSGGVGPALGLEEDVEERFFFHRVRRRSAKVVEESIPGETEAGYAGKQTGQGIAR